MIKIDCSHLCEVLAFLEMELAGARAHLNGQDKVDLDFIDNRLLEVIQRIEEITKDLNHFESSY